MLWLDGVCEQTIAPPQRKPRLHRARTPSPTQLTALAGTIAHRMCRHLARQGWIEGEGESARLSDSAGDDDAMDAPRMSAITCRIVTGMHAGRKVLELQTLPADAGAMEGDPCPGFARFRPPFSLRTLRPDPLCGYCLCAPRSPAAGEWKPDASEAVVGRDCRRPWIVNRRRHQLPVSDRVVSDRW